MTRTVDTRLEVIRGNARVFDLKTIDTPKITFDGEARIKSSLAATVLYDDRFDMLRDEIRAVLTVDGVDHPVGVFAVAAANKITNDDEVQLILEAYDRCWYAQAIKWEPTMQLEAGVNYIDPINELLVSSGITNIRATPTPATLPTVRIWDGGASYLDIINELLGEINYKELWFDASGAAVIEPRSVLGAEHIQHQLDGNSVKSLLIPGVEQQTDVFDAPNVFVLVCSNPDLPAPLVSRAENDNPSSPLSTMRRGRRIVTYIAVDNVADQAALDEMARLTKWESMAFGETAKCSTALLPGYGLDDVIALVYKDVAGIYISSAWTMDFVAGGEMEHTLKRLRYI